MTARYYWPCISLGIKCCISTCNISEKSDLRHHALFGLPQSISISSQPFNVVMEFILELPIFKGYSNILVVKDKLSKCTNFVLTSTSINEKGTVIAKFRIPRQVIMDRDVRQTGRFQKEISNGMSLKQSLTTAYQPQANGQAKVSNQTFEISLHACIGLSRDNWALQLNSSAFS